jgi:arginine decarboxylase
LLRTSRAIVALDQTDYTDVATNKQARPVLAVLTNSTYDGLCYNVQTTTRELSQSVDRIHYDEAWYAYARSNPLYEGRYGMHRGERHPDNATVTVTHSTHKLLAALSQASIDEAIAFRQAMARLSNEIRERNGKDWWFGVWQPDEVNGVPFAELDPEVLRHGDAWVLKPAASWHGFGDLGADYCMLDPIKVTVLTPGQTLDGKMENSGIPAPLVSSFLSSRGIVVEKTEPYSILVLFSLGVTKGKWGSLIAGLMEFKKHYESNSPLKQVLPDLVDNHAERYSGMGLKDLAEAMHQDMNCSTATSRVSSMTIMAWKLSVTARAGQSTRSMWSRTRI